MGVEKTIPNWSAADQLRAEDKQELQDQCGVVGIYSPTPLKLLKTSLKALDQLQTRGYDGAGILATTPDGDQIAYKSQGTVREVFTPAIVQKYEDILATIFLSQTRYGTNGAFNKDNVQPFNLVHKATGQSFGLIHNGEFSQEPGQNGIHSDTLHFAQQLASSPSENWDEIIESSLSTKKGAWSLIFSTPDGMYLARDQRGVRPLYYGQTNDERGNKIWAAASETTALEEIGVKIFYEVMPGSIMKINQEGSQFVSHPDSDQDQAVCMFEDVYIQEGSSKVHAPRINDEEINHSPTVEQMRYKSGQIIAREAPVNSEDIDFVIGIPGTAIPGGIGCADQLGLDYKQAIKDKLSPEVEQRTFMQADIKSIYQKVLDHFEFDREELKGKNIVLVDDSLVRGNIIKGLIWLLKTEYGVNEVHVRILSPPITDTCHLGVNTRTQEELIAHRHKAEVEKIRQEIGAESLAYLSSEGLKYAVVGDRQATGFCMGCMADHHHPIDKFGNPVMAAAQTVRTS